MGHTTVRGRRLRAGFATVALAVAAVLTFAAPAAAHNYYISSTPGIDEVLTSLPEEFVVTTNDNLLELEGTGGGFLLQIVGPAGLYYGDGCVSVAGPSVTTPAALGPPGDYSLNWQVISADGHTVSGEVPFRWEPEEGAESGTGSADGSAGESAEGSAEDSVDGSGAESSTIGSTSPPACAGSDAPASDDGADGTPGSSGTQDAGQARSEANTDILWIGGAIGAVALAVVATLLLIRPKKKPEDGPGGSTELDGPDGP